MTTEADFRPTHVVPQDGLLAWEAPDVNRPTAPLDALLPVQLVDRLGDWARIVCANDWSAWVDGRLLIAVPSDPPAASHSLTRTADPTPLLARAEEALSRYRRATEELASGGTDGETFRGRTRGLRVGVVVDGESMWLYDAEHERWVYCDGTRLTTYAAGEGPSVQGEADTPRVQPAVPPGSAAGPEPTQVVEAMARSGGTATTGDPDAPGPAPPAEAADATPGDDPTPRVRPTSGDPPDPASTAPPPEPTQVVEAVPDPGTAGGNGGGLAAASYDEGSARGGAVYGEGPVGASVAYGARPAAPAEHRDEPARARAAYGERAAAPAASREEAPLAPAASASGEDPVPAASREDPAPASYADEPTRRIPPVTVDPGSVTRARDE
ncbi:hypothetical protein [Streptomyces sp. NPDC054866]